MATPCYLWSAPWWRSWACASSRLICSRHVLGPRPSSPEPLGDHAPNLSPPEATLTAQRAKERQHAGICPSCDRFGVDPEHRSDETGRKDVAVVIGGLSHRFGNHWPFHSRPRRSPYTGCGRDAIPEGAANLREVSRSELHSARRVTSRQSPALGGATRARSTCSLSGGRAATAGTPSGITPTSAPANPRTTTPRTHRNRRMPASCRAHQLLLARPGQSTGAAARTHSRSSDENCKRSDPRQTKGLRCDRRRPSRGAPAVTRT